MKARDFGEAFFPEDAGYPGFMGVQWKNPMLMSGTHI